MNDQRKYYFVRNWIKTTIKITLFEVSEPAAHINVKMKLYQLCYAISYTKLSVHALKLTSKCRGEIACSALE